RPMRGLRAADFRVWRDGRPWPVVSVDDFCDCGDPVGSGILPAVTRPASPGPDRGGAPARSAADEPLFLFYFDFGQVRPHARPAAVEAARRWIRTVKKDGEPVMIAAYVTSRGLLTLQEPTPDSARLLAVLDRAEHDRLLSEPFAFELLERLE